MTGCMALINTLSPEFLRYAEKIVNKAWLTERISFRQGYMNNSPKYHRMIGRSIDACVNRDRRISF